MLPLCLVVHFSWNKINFHISSGTTSSHRTEGTMTLHCLADLPPWGAETQHLPRQRQPDCLHQETWLQRVSVREGTKTQYRAKGIPRQACSDLHPSAYWEPQGARKTFIKVWKRIWFPGVDLFMVQSCSGLPPVLTWSRKWFLRYSRACRMPLGRGWLVRCTFRSKGTPNTFLSL